jgi:hypothetical protein
VSSIFQQDMRVLWAGMSLYHGKQGHEARAGLINFDGWAGAMVLVFCQQISREQGRDMGRFAYIDTEVEGHVFLLCGIWGEQCAIVSIRAQPLMRL